MRPIPTLFAGNLVGAAAGGVFFLTASWSFDLEEMGRYAIAISAQWIATGLLGTGLSVATVRLATDRLVAGERAAAAGVVCMAAASAAAVGLAAAGLGLAASALGAGHFELPGRVMALVALWAGARSLLDCLRSGLLAQGQFTRVAVLVLLSAVTGLTALLFVVVSGPLRLERLLVAHVAGLAGGAVVACGLLAPLARSGIRVSADRFRELLSYARWPAFSEGTRLLQANLGPLALVALAGSAQAGLFSLGRYPAYLFEVVAVSLYQYWLPTASLSRSHSELASFLRRALRLAALLGLAMLGSALVLRPLLPWLGENFAAAAHLFALNALDFALVLMLRPVEATYHGLHRPHLELLLRAATLPFLGAGAVLLASRFGAEGMVWAHVLTGLVAIPLGLGLLRRSLAPQAAPGARSRISGGEP